MDPGHRIRETGEAAGLDSACAEGFEVVEQYVELELAGEDPATRFPSFALHLRSCGSCRALRDGVLVAARNERQRRQGI
jgi:hypothetical protein